MPDSINAADLLERLRKMAERFEDWECGGTPCFDVALGFDLASAFRGLDGYLCSGGRPPEEWTRKTPQLTQTVFDDDVALLYLAGQAISGRAQYLEAAAHFSREGGAPAQKEIRETACRLARMAALLASETLVQLKLDADARAQVREAAGPLDE